MHAETTISPMGMRDWNKIKHLREYLPHPALGSGKITLFRLLANLCFILSCNSVLRRAIYRIIPFFSVIPIVAKVDGVIAGITWLQGTGNKDVLDAGTIVFPEYQRRGIATMLHERREEEAKRWGAKRLEVTSLDSNYKNQALLKKRGYIIMRTYLGKDL